eukprot:SM003724S13678  [mRNA]  locus=s3724:36:925:+ [translate_table: standard]
MAGRASPEARLRPPTGWSQEAAVQPSSAHSCPLVLVVATCNPAVMPLQQRADGLHARRVDLVATPPAGGPRLLLDVVTTDSYDRSHPTQCATKAGYAFSPLAIDTHGALGARWLELPNQLS